MKRQKNYDKRVKLTRILLSDYLALKAISQTAGISMAEALHRLIEHQAQLPLLDRIARPMPVAHVTGVPMPAFRVAAMPAVRITPATTIATNGHKAVAFRIKPKGARYD